jgi:hypothetical protein
VTLGGRELPSPQEDDAQVVQAQGDVRACRRQRLLDGEGIRWCSSAAAGPRVAGPLARFWRVMATSRLRRASVSLMARHGRVRIRRGQIAAGPGHVPQVVEASADVDTGRIQLLPDLECAGSAPPPGPGRPGAKPRSPGCSGSTRPPRPREPVSRPAPGHGRGPSAAGRSPRDQATRPKLFRLTTVARLSGPTSPAARARARSAPRPPSGRLGQRRSSPGPGHLGDGQALGAEPSVHSGPGGSAPPRGPTRSAGPAPRPDPGALAPPWRARGRLRLMHRLLVRGVGLLPDPRPR